MAGRWADIERLYHAARERAPEDRAAFLDEACGGDAGLRQEVESLLGNETAAGGFLEESVLRSVAQDFASESTKPLALPSIPGYTILKTLGEGGMGVVYLAEQVEPIRRLVALKLIRHGMDSRHVVARFEAERQALALMHHPHIAAVFDAGTTTDGRPYFVMEYVEGVPITDYCDRQQLSTRARLELFLQVCAAVQHAHQKGVIHRDLKPSNILVSEQDGQPLPKVIDFGIAKAVDSTSAARTAFTDLGVMVGTPEYMSPEQAALSKDIDTATDVYSLGVVLYELLAGALPFDPKVLRAAGYDEMRRIIRENDPPKPSERLTRAETGVVAAARKTDATRLARQLKGDLDLITLKALQKDRHRRYDSIATFATDVGRYLADEPVAARPPSAAYRVRKFTRRYRAAVMGTAAAFVVLIAGLVSTILYVQAEGQRRVAEEREYGEYVATIAAADGELRLNLASSARARLLAVPAQQRGWEWHHLLLKTDPSLATLTSSAQCVELGAGMAAINNNILSIHDAGPRLYLRRCETLETWEGEGPSRTQSTLQVPGRLLAVSPSGDVLTVVTQGSGKETTWRVRLIDPATRRMRTEFGPFETEPMCAAISRNGKRVAVGTRYTGAPFDDGYASIFNLFDSEAGTEIARLAPRLQFDETRSIPPMSCMVAFSPDSTRFATSGVTVHIWQAESGASVATDANRANVVSQPIAWSADSSRLAIGRPTGLVDVLNLTSAPRLERFAGNGMIRVLTEPITDASDLSSVQALVITIAFAPDGRRIVTGTETTVGVWDVAQRRLVEALVGHSGGIVGIAFEADGGFATADTNGHVKLWRTAAPNATMTVTTGATGIVAGQVVRSADGSTVAVGQDDGGLSVWRLADLHRTELRASRAAVPPPPALPRLSLIPSQLALSPDGRLLIVVETDFANGKFRSWLARAWNLEAGGSKVLADNEPVEPECATQRTIPYYRAMSISPDGRSLAYLHGTCLFVRDLATWVVRARRPGIASRELIFRSDGSLLFLNHERRPDGRLVPSTLSIWDWEKGKTVSEATLPPFEPTFREVPVRLSPDGAVIAFVVHSYTEKGRTQAVTVQFWDSNLRRELGHLSVPTETHDVVFSADGRRLASDGNAVIRIWDVERRRLLLALKGDGRSNFAVGFTPDGKLIAGGGAGALTIWETKTPKPPPPR